MLRRKSESALDSLRPLHRGTLDHLLGRRLRRIPAAWPPTAPCSAARRPPRTRRRRTSREAARCEENHNATCQDAVTAGDFRGSWHACLGAMLSTMSDTILASFARCAYTPADAKAGAAMLGAAAAAATATAASTHATASAPDTSADRRPAMRRLRRGRCSCALVPRFRNQALAIQLELPRHAVGLGCGAALRVPSRSAHSPSVVTRRPSK